MTTQYDRFLPMLPKGGRILDAGCGSGRDAKAFIDAGYEVVAFDASTKLVDYATKFSGQPAFLMTFADMNWVEEFHGIWACASLLHVPQEDFPDIAEKFVTALKSNGVWYMSFKLGSGQRMKDDRQFVDHTSVSLQSVLGALRRISLSEIWETSDVRKGRESEKWVNALAIKE